MKFHCVSDNIFTIDSFLSNEQCQKFISQAELLGFQCADVEIGNGRSLLSNIRNNDRVDWFSEELASAWWQQLPQSEIPNIESKKAIGLSPRFRFYRYQAGQKFNMHKDGRQHVTSNTTMMTLLVYLNDGFIGGCTKFRQDNLEIQPRTGKALIFEHHLWHQGKSLQSGTKYVLRTDIVFQG
jgi:hypothetical protein